MSCVLVVAPHPDDKSLGCRGTLLRHANEGDEVHWTIVTEVSVSFGFSPDKVAARADEIEKVAAHYGFAGVHRLGFPTTRLDTIPLVELISSIAETFQRVQPETLYLPFRGDAHSDHGVVFDACAACTKWFRHSSVKRVRAYETLSETEFGLASEKSGFQPNLFIDIADYLEGKIAAMRIYKDEMGTFPFPRSEETIRALAALRGSACGSLAAETFISLREIVS